MQNQGKGNASPSKRLGIVGGQIPAQDGASQNSPNLCIGDYISLFAEDLFGFLW
jgi:hypothetical protein